MGKKRKMRQSKPPINTGLECNNHGFKCNICGKIVAPIDRSSHLIMAHKLSGYNIKIHYTDTGKDFKSRQSNKTAAYQKAYERNSKAVRTEFDFEPEEPKPIKIIYTPMGNRR